MIEVRSGKKKSLSSSIRVCVTIYSKDKAVASSFGNLLVRVLKQEFPAFVICKNLAISALAEFYLIDVEVSATNVVCSAVELEKLLKKISEVKVSALIDVKIEQKSVLFFKK